MHSVHVSDGFAAQTAKRTDVVAAAPSRLVPLHMQQRIQCTSVTVLLLKLLSIQMW
jgi:hypothetical protein